MEARAKLLGHPIHQMLIPIPLGLFTVAVLIDIASLFADVGELTQVSFWNIALGLIGAVVAAVFGALDWTRIPSGTRAKSVGTLHGAGNLVVAGLFAVAVALRVDEPARGLTAVALALEIAAFVLVAVTGWLGGELVDRLGVGVTPHAHPDAPSSLVRSGGKHRVREREVPRGGAPSPV